MMSCPVTTAAVWYDRGMRKDGPLDPGSKPEQDLADESHELGQTVYSTLRRLAATHLRRERSDHTLQPTALVHEAWMRLEEDVVSQGAKAAHFYALASRVMRRILVDHARTRAAAKRGGGWQRVTLSHDRPMASGDEIDVLALNEAMEALKEVAPRQARIVEMRFFGGVSNALIAEALHVSIPTITREWRVAQAWLLARLSDEA